MYIEESGSDLTVTVEGEEYHTEATGDADSDGLDDTAIVETDDGAIAFTDTDADGQADLMTQLDANGDVVGRARFDEATGEWVDVHDGAAGSSLTATTPDGEIRLGAPTHDTDGDGAADTVVVYEDDATAVYTDGDEDGDADFRTEIAGDGTITVSERAADGEWTVVERGSLDEDGEYHAETGGAAAEESGWITSGSREVRTDPRTGDWVHG